MKILLICYGGLSTSMLVNNMKKAVENSEKLKDKGIVIEACGKEEYADRLEGAKILLLGPQVSMIKDDVTKVAKSKGYDIPVDVIDKKLYGLMDGEAVLIDAFNSIREFKNK